jgi:hypothetical protein
MVQALAITQDSSDYFEPSSTGLRGADVRLGESLGWFMLFEDVTLEHVLAVVISMSQIFGVVVKGMDEHPEILVGPGVMHVACRVVLFHAAILSTLVEQSAGSDLVRWTWDNVQIPFSSPGLILPYQCHLFRSCPYFTIISNQFDYI